MKITKFSPSNVLPNMVHVIIMSAYTCHSGYVRIRMYVCNAHIYVTVSAKTVPIGTTIEIHFMA